MDLSIITVCRNTAATLPRCLASTAPLLRSSELQVEHLIIDGASTDNTPELLAQALREQRISRYISEPDSGIYNAMNKGLALASGTISVFINADDEIGTDAVAACCRPILEGHCDYTVSTARLIAADGSERAPWKPDFERIWIGVPYCHQTLYCRTELLRQLGGFDESLRIAADTDLIGRLYKGSYPHTIVDAISAVFYQGGASAGDAMYSEQLSEVLKHTDDILIRAAERPGYTDAALRMLLFHISRYFRHARPAQRDRLVIRAMKLHRSLAALLPAPRRRKLRLRYSRKARLYRLLALLPGSKSADRLLRSGVYATLADCC